MSLVSKVLDRIPYVGRMRRELRAVQAREGKYPAGHYYSPIPNEEDLRRDIEHSKSETFDQYAGIDLNEASQFALLEKYASYYRELPFTEEPVSGLRYFFAQEWFCYADAIFLYSHLRETLPERIIEVGSGYSSAVILDTIERFFPQKPEVVFIEPHPERLFGLLRPDDIHHVTVVEDIVQNASTSLFSSLHAGDLLFVDSSHVVKAGSDVYFLFFEILPILDNGVIVHFHDIFRSFDYPTEWLLMGRYWNEAYFLRAFLAYNSEWQIRFFNSYVGWRYREYLAENLPLCLKNTGGSLYIERAT